MIRPENVQLGAAEGTPGTVVRANFMGIQTIYQVAVLGTQIEAVEMGTNPRYTAGDTVVVTLPSAHCMAYAA